MEILKDIAHNYWIILLLVIGCSCGSRKVDKQHHEFKSDLSFVDSSYVLNQNSRLNDTGEFTPIDNTKPFIVDGKEYFNVSIKFDKSKFDSIKIEKKNISTVSSTSELIDNKKTEKTDYTVLIIGLGLFALIGAVLFFRY
jgi:hypothetical protein